MFENNPSLKVQVQKTGIKAVASIKPNLSKLVTVSKTDGHGYKFTWFERQKQGMEGGSLFT